MLSDTPPPNSALIAYATEEALRVCTHLSTEIAPKSQLPEWPGVDIRSVERQASGKHRLASSRGVQAANVTHGWSQVVTTWDCKAPYSIDFRLYYWKRTKVPVTTIKCKAHLHVHMPNTATEYKAHLHVHMPSTTTEYKAHLHVHMPSTTTKYKAHLHVHMPSTTTEYKAHLHVHSSHRFTSSRRTMQGYNLPRFGVERGILWK